MRTEAEPFSVLFILLSANEPFGDEYEGNAYNAEEKREVDRDLGADGFYAEQAAQIRMHEEQKRSADDDKYDCKAIPAPARAI